MHENQWALALTSFSWIRAKTKQMNSRSVVKLHKTYASLNYEQNDLNVTKASLTVYEVLKFEPSEIIPKRLWKPRLQYS